MTSRYAQAVAPEDDSKPSRPAEVQLLNPVQAQFSQFCTANAVFWQSRAAAMLEDRMPPEEYAAFMADFLSYRPSEAWAKSGIFRRAVQPIIGELIVRPDSARGRTVAICGAGPSLARNLEVLDTVDEVWATNSALPWLVNRKLKCTHGITVDQTPAMVTEWKSRPAVAYLLPSTVHPSLVEHIRHTATSIRFFHNYVGMTPMDGRKNVVINWADQNGVGFQAPYEDWQYLNEYPVTIRAGSGLNSVTRALDVAEYMGFDQIYIVGADSCIEIIGKFRDDFEFNSPAHIKWLKRHTKFHANGDHAVVHGATSVTMAAVIDAGTEDDTVRPGHGRLWVSKPDLLISAQWLLRMARASGGKIVIVGDTLVNALVNKNEDYLRRLPNFVDRYGNVAGIPVFGNANANL